MSAKQQETQQGTQETNIGQVTPDGYRIIAIPEAMIPMLKEFAELKGARMDFKSAPPDGVIAGLLIAGMGAVTRDKLAALKLQADRETGAVRRRLEGLSMAPEQIAETYQAVADKWNPVIARWRKFSETIKLVS